MTSITDTIQTLIDDVKDAQETVEAVRTLSLEGGNFRLTLSVDHPDHNIVERVEALAKRRMPRTNMMPSLIKAAEDEVTARQADLLKTARFLSVDLAQEPQLAAE